MSKQRENGLNAADTCLALVGLMLLRDSARTAPEAAGLKIDKRTHHSSTAAAEAAEAASIRNSSRRGMPGMLLPVKLQPAMHQQATLAATALASSITTPGQPLLGEALGSL